ncbi:hypothetical protein NVP1084O_144 [Vibrio phage 1.084.O._10N.261.49.F5]|nr:hypothetical protein NVP1084O_144 [Vibrio phage 1.084.O._10N.261.49.F5]
MNLIIPKDLLPFVDKAREYLSRPVYLVKCIAYMEIKGITLQEIENTIAAKYERANNDKPDRAELGRKGRD